MKKITARYTGKDAADAASYMLINFDLQTKQVKLDDGESDYVINDSVEFMKPKKGDHILIDNGTTLERHNLSGCIVRFSGFDEKGMPFVDWPLNPVGLHPNSSIKIVYREGKPFIWPTIEIIEEELSEQGDEKNVNKE